MVTQADQGFSEEPFSIGDAKAWKVVAKKATTLIEMRSFELDPLGWSLTAATIEFNREGYR